MISGPMPSPWATVIGTAVGILRSDLSCLYGGKQYMPSRLGKQKSQEPQRRQKPMWFPAFLPMRFIAKLELETQPEAYLSPSVPCSRASMVTAPVRDRESDDVRLRR